MSCGVGHRCGSDPALLWLWHRLAAKAPIRPLAWEPPYAAGVALDKAKKKKKIFFSQLGEILVMLFSHFNNYKINVYTKIIVPDSLF